MKHLRFLLFAFLALCCRLTSFAYDYEYNGIYYNLDAVNQTATVTYRTTSYNSYSGNITVPETMIGPKSIQYTVVSIGDDAFRSCSNLSSVTIPVTVETIGARAFKACTNITTISIPNMVSSIGAEAFSGCTKLVSATLPRNYLTTISENLFYGCSSLETIQIPSTVTTMGNYAFQNCTKLASVSLSTRTQTIGNYTFSGCSALASVTIPASVRSIGSYAFQSCSKLTSVSMSSGLQTIGSNAFRSCTLLPSVAIPNTVTSLGSGAFYGCSALNSVTLSTALTSLPDECFRNCSTLPAITIPALVTTISSSTFTGCSKLASITFAEGMTSIPRSYATMVNTVNLPSTATTIVSQAFSGFSSLSAITLPANLTTIESQAFYGCSALSSVALSANLTTIESQAFYGCSALPRVTIPAKVATIGTDAFANCNNLTELTYAAGTRTALRTYATKLTKVTFPPSCFDFAPDAFSGCTALTSIYISDLEVWNYIFRNMASNPFACAHNIYVNNTLLTELAADFSPAINSYAFAGTKSLRSVITGTGVTSIKTGAFSGCSDLQSFRGNDALTAIDGYAFSNCPALNTVRMGSHVTAIGAYAFSGCEGLTTLRLSPAVTSIGDYAFNNCYTLASINLPTGISAIRPYTFYNCRLLEDIEIPATVTQVGDRAFYGCETLKTFTLSNTATTVGNYAFYGCTTLRNAYLGTGITSIGTYAFSKCPNLLGFYLSAANVPSTGSNAFTDSDPTYINLYVPDGSLSAYAAATPWKDFIKHGLSEAPVYVRSITLNPEVVKLTTSGTGTITATTSPSNATNSGVNWSSSNTGVVYVNSGGALMANAEGIATITARAKDAYGASAEAVVIVSDNFIGVSSLSLSSTTLTLAEGEEHHLTATVSPSSATYKVVKWTSSNPDVVSVASDGQLTALSSGSATITAKSADGTNRTATCRVTVTSPSLPGGSTGPLTFLALNQDSYTGVVGESIVVSTQKFPYRSSTTLTWRCADSRVTLTPNASNGTCTITASISTTTTITVSGNGLSSTAELVIEPLTIICASNMMAPRSTKQLTTNATSPVVWRSSDEDVATVSADGLVTAKCVGDVTITAVSTTNSNLVATRPLYVRLGVEEGEWVVLSSVAYHSGSDRYYIDDSPSFRKIKYTKNGTSSTTPMSYSRLLAPSGTLYYFQNSGNYGILGIEGNGSSNVYCNANNVQTDANGYLVLDLQTVEQGYWQYESFQSNFGKNTVWMFAETPSIHYTTVNTYSAWTSTNTAHSSTSSHTYNITYSAGQQLSFDWSVSSESGYDFLTITLDGTQIVKESGSKSGTYTKTFTTSGTAVLVATYSKDNSNSNGSDQGKIYNIRLMAEDPNWAPNPIAEHEYVDLGLPSGTLWATCNIGAATPDASGEYFAWGEVAPKSRYYWSTYEHCNGSGTTLTKYNTDSSYGTVDNRTELELIDDAAYVNWGTEWQMPNSTQEEELRTACTWTWTTCNGHNGYTVTGPNENTIFLPACGTKSGTSSPSQQTGTYWINHCSNSVSHGMSLEFSSTSNNTGSNHYKYEGLPVRPVRRFFGDVNNDGEVTIGDVIATVNFILNTNTSGFLRSAADVNHDGTVTAADATGVINLVLGLPVDAANSPRRVASRSKRDADVQFTIDRFTIAEDAETLVPVSLCSNDDEFTALQFDVLLPERIRLTDVLCDDDHMAAFAQQADGKMRIVVLSPDNVPFAGNGLAALTLQLAADADAAPGTIAVDAIEVARHDMSRVAPSAFSAAFGFAGPTGIESVESTANSPLYDIQGRRTAGAVHGIYVTQGRKVVK